MTEPEIKMVVRVKEALEEAKYAQDISIKLFQELAEVRLHIDELKSRRSKTVIRLRSVPIHK